MSTTGPLFVHSFNPVWSLVELTGKQFDDTFYLWVLQNEIPYLPAPVYHTPTGTLWTDPIQFLANGTLPLDIYWDPNITYRLEFRQNLGLAPPSQADPLIYLVENYSPNSAGNTPISVGGVFTDNQITNAQFSDINFITPYTFTGVNPPSIPIAPGWFLDLTGNGTVEVQQVPLNNATTNPTNAPYALRITLTGSWTGAPILRQRLNQNGMLWANKNVAVSFTALINGAAQQVTARIDDSNGTPQALLLTTLLTNSFVEYTGNALMPATTNPDVPPAAWLDFKFILPPVCDIYVTSLQLIASDEAINISYEQETVDRQIDHEFHYYKPILQFKPVPSYLIGWDFPLNPAQFLGTTIAAQPTGANSSYYAWDQTILFQSANNGLTVSRGTRNGFKVTAATATQFAMIQYLGATEARELLQNNMSVNLNCFPSITAGSVVSSISLWYTKDANLPSVAGGTNQSFIATLDPATGRPATITATFNWTEISRLNLQNCNFTLQNGVLANLPFNGWSLANGVPADANSATFFAIVVGFAPLSAADSIEFMSVGLMAGDDPTIPAPKTQAQTILDCNRYYWKTFNPGIVPAQNIGTQTGEFIYTSGKATGTNQSPSIFFPVPMRATPNITLYNPAAANANVRDETLGGDCSVPGNEQLTRVSTNVFCTGNAGTTVGNLLGVHITADARYGIVN